MTSERDSIAMLKIQNGDQKIAKKRYVENVSVNKKINNIIFN